MDMSFIAVANSAIGAAREIGRAAIGLRDFNQLAVVVAQLNEQLLKAQESLIAHNAQLMAMQQEEFKTREKLRKMQEALAERGKYALLEISPGVFVYRSRADFKPESGGANDPGLAEPQHNICQVCFDGGRKIILHRMEANNRTIHICPLCKTEYLESTKRSTFTSRPGGSENSA